jgi:hypothetical protein
MTIDEAIASLRAAGRLSDEQAAAIRADASVPREGGALAAWLTERNLGPVGRLESAVSAETAIPDEEPTPLQPVPPGHDDRPFVPEDASSSNLLTDTFDDSPVNRRRPPAPTMSRETMWKWIGIGGGMWLLGLLILGLWIGGCLSDTPKPRFKPKASDGKLK